MIPASRIAARFNAAAASYDQSTRIQSEVAQALAARVLAEPTAPGIRVVEFGCGTGHLTRTLIGALEPELWLASDAAPAMLDALEARLDHPALQLMRLNAARPPLEREYDLVCSSLTLQWLEEPGAAVARWRDLVEPGGRLAVSTLLDGSFAEWRAAVRAAGAPEPGPAFADLETARAWFAPDARLEVLTLIDRHASALDFARAAHAAGIDAGAGRPLSPAVMRRALRALDQSGAAVTYRVLLMVERVG